jgi:hypothetical protein
MRASIEELASFVDHYQGGQVSDAEEHVTDWLEMFDEPDRVADELAHVLRRSFLTREQAAAEIAGWLAKPKKVSRGRISSWDETTFLDVAAGGGSQHAVLDLFDKAAVENGEEPIRSRSGGVFVYADDVSVQGMRLLNDLTPWMEHEAPAEFELVILLQRRLAGRESYLTNTLRERARSAGKKLARITFWCNEEFSSADCYSPAVIPENEDVAAWISKANIKPPTLRTGTGSGRFFSSDAARRMIESEFLIAGARILAKTRNLQQKKHMRPLGNTVWPSLGIGVPIVTWRNCPNSAPLALWAEGIVAPLFPRQSN